MNLDSLSFALIHITNLVGNLTKKNSKASCQEIAQVRFLNNFSFVVFVTPRGAPKVC